MLSYICCCCSSHKTPPLSADEAHNILQRGDDAREELRLFAAMWCRGSKAHPLELQLAQIGTRQKKHFCWVGTERGSSGGGGYFGWLFPSTRRGMLS